MRNDILHTIRYFAFFQYPPTLKELYTFHKQAVDFTEFTKTVDRLVSEKVLMRKKYARNNIVFFRYTARGYTTFFKTWKERYDNSNKKMNTLFTFVHNAKYVSVIQLIGLSGSLSMYNGKKDDDIDVFIIARKNRLWTTRFVTLFLAQLMGVRRKRGVATAKDKICMNLFFEETDLQLPAMKHTEYAAHEVLQMRPLINRGDTYMRFLDANRWVFDLFPNATRSRKIPYQLSRGSIHIPLLGDVLEYILRRFQLYVMKGHRKDERITETQLWFFPDDFEKKIKITP